MLKTTGFHFFAVQCCFSLIGILYVFFMDLSVSSFVFHSSLLTAKSVNLAVAHVFVTEIVHIFKVSTFKQFLICTQLCNGLSILTHNGYFTFEAIFGITGTHSTIT